MSLCTISYQPEAYEVAANHLRRLIDYTMTVVPYEGEPFDATLIRLVVNNDDGQYKAVFARWNAEAGTGDRNDTVTLDIYDDVARVKVI